MGAQLAAFAIAIAGWPTWLYTADAMSNASEQAQREMEGWVPLCKADTVILSVY